MPRHPRTTPRTTGGVEVAAAHRCDLRRGAPTKGQRHRHRAPRRHQARVSVDSDRICLREGERTRRHRHRRSRDPLTHQRLWVDWRAELLSGLERRRSGPLAVTGRGLRGSAVPARTVKTRRPAPLGDQLIGHVAPADSAPRRQVREQSHDLDDDLGGGALVAGVTHPQHLNDRRLPAHQGHLAGHHQPPPRQHHPNAGRNRRRRVEQSQLRGRLRGLRTSAGGARLELRLCGRIHCNLSG